MAFPFLAIFLTFLIVLAIRYKVTDNKVKEQQEQFWQRESDANFAPKIDLDSLTYITIPLDKFPLGFSDDQSIVEIENQLTELSSHRLLNLTNKTNTELKETYGLANLETVSAYGDDFDQLTILLKEYGQCLINNDKIDDAIKVLEFGVSIKSDISQNYIMLGECYKKKGTTYKIEYLIQQIESMNLILGPSTIKHLQELLGNSDQTDSNLEDFNS
ncbi:MAG: hypothetical protein K6B67_10495 [Lachnospiraceae bacterium]|nr:hypothetical protein [Lachnospiraceae bacterium]